MIDCCDEQYLADEITATKALIAALRAAITALATGGVQSYSLDTGQTRQVVTRSNLSEMRLSLKEAQSYLSTLLARGGCGRFNVRPGW